MISLINSIGQRKTSKLLCGITFLVSFIVQVLAYGALYATTTYLWMGCALITLPNILLSISAHTNLKHRIKCIYGQIFFVVLNLVILLFVPSAFLVPIFVGEIILTGIVSLIVYALPDKSSRSSKSKSRSSTSKSSKSEESGE